MAERLPGELSELLKDIRAALDRLDAGQLTQLKTHTQTTGDFNAITSEIKQELSRIDSQLDELELLADEAEDEPSRTHALAIVEDHRNQATRLRGSFRAISLDVKRALSNSTLESARAELLSGATPKAARSSNTQDALISASSDVTQSLRNTLEIMRQELDRSVMSTHLLEQQTATLQLTSDQYLSFGELMKTSRALISSLQRADLLDRILLTGALAFFVLVCLYIIKKRILDRGVSLLSTLLSPLSRTTAKIISTNEQAAVALSSTGQQDELVSAAAAAAAAAATASAVAFLPSLASPDLPPPVIEPPLTSTPANPSVPEIPEIELLHEEL
ncbi:hypothetical protein PTTG_04178 [Puccinia triticina 1-1 BBBD Race 1]|uniref:Sec20 C-terminal domain-containing protein n=1 Tax=Puccinia triticina (isolate 1-1 / race 1 (BBBD)) TaxID=630390 RepID=A0A180GTE9_PUCT1|nr:hypothetical protein PTTG_04178 [Puccinia triticina 1-1 BBBD Race 1]